MKTLISVIAVLALGAPAVNSQDEQPQPKSNVVLKKPQKGAELMATQPARPQPALKPEKRPVEYGGFLADVAKAENPRETLSLRQPIAETGDPPNVMRDPVTGRARGFILFAIRF